MTLTEQFDRFVSDALNVGLTVILYSEAGPHALRYYARISALFFTPQRHISFMALTYEALQREVLSQRTRILESLTRFD